jgi:hypothetical protein
LSLDRIPERRSERLAKDRLTCNAWAVEEKGDIPLGGSA